jgi:hypothetical protein
MNISMKYRALSVFVCVALASLILTTVAVAVFTAPITANNPARNGLAVTIGGQPWQSGQVIAFGDLNVGDNSKDVTVKNTGNSDLTLAVSATGTLPSGITFSNTLNGQVVKAGVTATGTITLAVSDTAAPNTISLNLSIGY